MKLKDQNRWFDFWLAQRGPTFISCRFGELFANRVEQLMEDKVLFSLAIPHAVKSVLYTYNVDFKAKFLVMNILEPEPQRAILLDGFRILEEVWELGDLLKDWRKEHGDPQISCTPSSAGAGTSGKEHKEGSTE